MKVENTIKDYDNVAKLVMLVYGVGGVGKTTFASTFPKPLLLDFENGAKYFKQRGIDVDVVRMQGWFTTEDKKQLAEIVKDYETIVFDPIGEMMEKLIKSDTINGSKYRQADGGLTMAGWGAVKDHARAVLKWARDLNKNVVLVAHVDEKSDDEALVKRPLIATKLGDEIIALVDVVGYLDILQVEGEEKRVLRVNPADKKYIAKDRTGALPSYVKPEYDYIHNLIAEKQAETTVEPEEDTAEPPAEEPKKPATKKAAKKATKKSEPKEDTIDVANDPEANPFANKK